MTDRPLPRWIAAVYHRASDGGWNQGGFAEIDLDFDLADRLEALMDRAKSFEETLDEGHLEAITVQLDAAPVTWHRGPGFHGFHGGSEDFSEILLRARDSAQAVEIGDRLELPEEVRPVHRPTLAVRPHIVQWHGMAELRQETEVKTGGVTRTDLALVRLYGGETETVRRAFLTLSESAPHLALKILENGLQPSRGGGPHREIGDLLREEDLTALLQDSRQRHRERALAALADLGRGGRSR